MPGLLIKKISRDLHRKLKKRAAANRRSLTGEVIVILERAAHEAAEPPTIEEIDKLRVRGRQPLRETMIDRARRREP